MFLMVDQDMANLELCCKRQICVLHRPYPYNTEDSDDHELAAPIDTLIY
jgi:hypothetical protein